MKFGSYLEQHKFPPWKNEYIQYNQIKYFLKTTQLSLPGWTAQDEQYFAETMIVGEINKVNGFIHIKIQQLESLMHQENVQQKVNDLIDFIKLNATGFRKILKKHDKWTSTALQQTMRFQGIQNQFDASVQRLINMQAPMPAEVAPALSTLPPPPPQYQPKVTTTKYWIHPDNLAEVQALLMFYLPIKQYNHSNHSVISTVYFDHQDQFHRYAELLERREAAETIRARWYGLISNSSDIHIERKIHYESWSHNKGQSVKEGFTVKSARASDYINYGRGPQIPLAAQMYQTIQQQQLKSTLRSYHHRTTYQQNPNQYRVLLDTKITFMKENGTPWRRNDIGEAYPFDHLTASEVYFFPFAVLETKFVENMPTPHWLISLIESQLVYEVPYFSKYLHGASHFYREKLPMLPWWLGELNADIRRKPSYAAAIPNQSSREFQAVQQCITIEPTDYVAATDQLLPRRSKEFTEQDDDLFQHNASACTVVEGSPVGAAADPMSLFSSDTNKITLAPVYIPTLPPPVTATTAVVVAPTETKGFTAPTEKDPNHVSLMTWLYAKITNNKDILLDRSAQQQQRIMPKNGKKKKIEPKIFFANERTFISWLQFSALLLAVSLGLINFGDNVSRGSGAFFIVVAVILAGYAQLRFQYRAWQIRFRSESRFDDLYGPAVLCFVLVITLFINLGLRLQQPLPSDPSPFAYNVTSNNNSSSISNINNIHNISNIGHTTSISHTTGTSSPTSTSKTTNKAAATLLPNGNFSNGTRIDKHGKLVPIEEEDEGPADP